jgi:5-methylthioadenosine/S-adenosylhomocysteine deaminase
MTRRLLLTGGYVLTMDPAVRDLEHGDVLVQDGKIVAIEPHIAVGEDDEVVDTTGKIVMPGLLDTHTHLWQVPIRGLAADCWGQEYFTTIHPFSQRVDPHAMYAGTHAGALELLANGVTTVVDFCHSIHSPEHVDASLDALEASGIRAIFGYSLRDRPELESRTLRSTADRMDDIRRVRERRAADGARVGLAVALNNIEHVTPEDGAAEIAFARELGLPMTVHSIRDGQVRDLHRRGLLGPDLQWVHATAIADTELEMLADLGGGVATTPEAEALTLGAWPVTGRAVAAGVPVGLGMDLVSALGASITNQVRSAVVLDRLLTAHNRRVQGHPPVRDGSAEPMDARRALELATLEGARSIGMDATIGSLAPGKSADILVLSVPGYARPASDVATHVAMQTSRADVDTVLVDGRVRVRSGRLVDVDLGRLGSELDTARATMTGRRAPASAPARPGAWPVTAGRS